MKKEFLEACPFCGSLIVRVIKMPRERYFIECPRCLASSGVRETRKEAVAAWNRRVND